MRFPSSSPGLSSPQQLGGVLLGVDPQPPVILLRLVPAEEGGVAVGTSKTTARVGVEGEVVGLDEPAGFGEDIPSWPVGHLGGSNPVGHKHHGHFLLSFPVCRDGRKYEKLWLI